MKSPNQSHFANNPSADIPRSSFNRSHGLKTTFDAGYLVPVYADEALPGDTFNLKMSSFARLATPIVPIMDNLYMDTFFFAVPYRLIWDNWQKFNGEQRNPDDSTDFLCPTMTETNIQTGTLSDYLGLPTNVALDITYDSFWHRAYNLIWNEWFRDQNMQDSLVVDTDDGPDAPGVYLLQRRGKRHDYFTSCLPWPQKATSVGIPMPATAPVISNQEIPNFVIATPSSNGPLRAVNSTAALSLSGVTPTGTQAAWFGSTTGLVTDLDAATAATINELRQAVQIQKLYERDARGGTRYTEILKAHFGVTSPDARLQRPEYLGGGSTPINIHPVQQTSSTDATTPQGNLAAFGTSSASGHGFTKSFTEHCILLGLVSVRADLTYQQGLNRMFSRQTRWDFYWPALSHLGEQAVLEQEIFCTGNPALDEEVFGYQERYAEYRYKPSLITGKFRSSDPTSLDIWHVAQDFSVAPILDSTFIAENPPIDRVIAVDSEPHLLFDGYFDLNCVRPMPVNSIPGLMDHF